MTGLLYDCESSKNVKDIKENFVKNYPDINSSNENLNILTIIYKYNSIEEKIQILGEKFVENNKNNYLLVIDGFEYNSVTRTTFFLTENQKRKEYLKIYFIQVNTIINMNEMFRGCKSLYCLPDISLFVIDNVNDMSYLFSGCTSLKSLPDISK